MGAIIFIMAAPFISIGAWIIIAIVHAFNSNNSSSIQYKGGPKIAPDVPDNIPERQLPDYPDIADQFDGRLTNVFKNPWKGIL